MAEPPLSGLEALAPEVQELIISHVATIQALHSLIRASPRFYQVFYSHKELALSNLASRLFHPAVLPDALAAVEASHLDQPRTRDNVIEFLRGFPFRQHQEGSSVRYPLQTSIKLCQLYRNVTYLVTDYHQRSMLMLTKWSCSASKPYPTVSVINDGPDSVLSEIEVRRFQRAFCRFETYRHLFARDQSTGTTLTVSEQAIMFLEVFSEWEIEEMACVRDYLFTRLIEVFGAIEDCFVQAARASKTPIWDETLPDLPDHWETEDRWFSCHGKSNHEAYMEHMLSLGLPFLRQMFEENDEEKKNLVIANSRYGRPFLTEALNHPRRQFPASHDNHTAYFQWSVLSSDSDNLRACNEGWLWGQGYRPALQWADRTKKSLRDLGYVFWDKKRSESSGILSLDADAVGRHLDDSHRDIGPSAQERLEGRQPGYPWEEGSDEGISMSP